MKLIMFSFSEPFLEAVLQVIVMLCIAFLSGFANTNGHFVACAPQNCGIVSLFPWADGSMVFWNFLFEPFLGIFWDVEIPQGWTNDTCSKKLLWSELLCGLFACGYGNCFKRGHSGYPISFCKQ